MDWSGVTGSVIGALGDACTYRHTDGRSVAVTAVIRDGVEVVDDSGQLIERVRAATLKAAALLTVPKMGDTLTVGARTYTVQRLMANDGYAVQVALT